MSPQCARVLSHMQKYGPITQAIAVEQYGCYRLSARIYDLRRQGYNISAYTVTGCNRFGDKVSWNEYKLIGDC